jgi:hypothetical protein
VDGLALMIGLAGGGASVVAGGTSVGAGRGVVPVVSADVESVGIASLADSRGVQAMVGWFSGASASPGLEPSGLRSRSSGGCVILLPFHASTRTSSYGQLMTPDGESTPILLPHVARRPPTAILPISVEAERDAMNTARAREAAGRQIEVLFGDADGTLVLELGEENEADDVAAVLVDCLRAPTFDDAEGRLQAGIDGLDGLDGTVRRAP